VHRIVTGPGERSPLRDALASLAMRRETDRLPARVLATIARQDNSSEVLVKLIQLAVVIVFGTLYAISPKTDAGTAFSPVPYALAGYLAVNLAGLAWAVRRGLPNWAVYASIVVDIALLMVLIWSFHIQYEQPPSFYLKAPTVLYIFIFIALRTLRFQARFVIAAGLIAALGWLGLVAYVITADPADMMITRDYVEYLTSNAILIGAEFDKVISILMVTAILALALKRAHGLLVRAVSEGAAAEDLSRFFDAGVAARIRGADRPIAAGEGVKRQAAVLNIDIRGFTALAASEDADRVMTMLAEYQRRLIPIIQVHGGTIDKFLGDGIMATFGATAEADRFAADALAAMDAVMEEAARWGAPGDRLPALAVNAAVAAGEIVFGAVGDEKRLEYTVIGPAVNLSAKLEKHNKALRTRALATLAAYELARTQGYVPPGEPEIATTDIPGAEAGVPVAIMHR